jgi:hypothetical protein
MRMNSVYLVYGRVSNTLSDKKLSEDEAELPAWITEKKNGIFSHLEAEQTAASLEVKAPPLTKWHWKNLTLMRCLASAHIEAVSFIPIDVRCSQTLFARRTVAPDETGFVPPLALQNSTIHWIPTEATLLETTKDIDGAFVAKVRKVLQCFQKDKETLAIALTFPSATGSITRIWGMQRS